jgi:hypothetical protein
VDNPDFTAENKSFNSLISSKFLVLSFPDISPKCPLLFGKTWGKM